MAITSVFNDGYIAEMYESYRRDPASVEESWRQYFRFAEDLAGTAPAAGAPAGAADPAFLRKVAGAASLVQAIRHFGHLAVQIDPLGTPPLGAPELTPEFHGITEADLAQIPGPALGFPHLATGTDVLAMLRRRYMSNFGFEYMHVASEEEREWFRAALRAEELTRPLSPDEKKKVLERLTEVDGLERFLGRAYQGKKRFSIEGTDAMVPMLDEAIAEFAHAGGREVVIAMAHRGRLNVLTHILGKPYAKLFEEFEGWHAPAPADSVADTGDVKYHMGYEGTRTVDGREVGLTLVPNPSHLEVVNPVINGVARAHQRTGAAGAPGARDENAVLTVCIHGDAAFIGEGVVAETLNLSRLRGFRVGGTLHLIANNQVGFTTDPIDSRSTHYASDLAKGFDIPVIHVNGDDPAACLAAVRLGIAYRRRFGKDFLIDLVGYRRHGHNETDEPAFTQPELYKRVRAHPTPRQVWGARLVQDGVLAEADVEAVDQRVAQKLEKIWDEVKKAGDPSKGHDTPEGAPARRPAAIETAVPAERLTTLNEQLLKWPDGFTPNATLARVLGRRKDGLQKGIDWGHAEALAFASLLVDGTSIRLSGQDAERGTFSHRQAVLHDMQTGETYMPLANLPESRASVEVYNSPLSETAVMGFEYGYSTAAEDTLVLWEAQYGDFANVAQPIVDQFLSADRAKWGQDSGLVLLLPHGHEGGGPEHSSARLERYLQMCAEGNMTVAYPSTTGQYFHLVRRQAKRDPRRPLVVMQPKSLLRLAAAAVTVEALASGTFQPVLDDPIASRNPGEVTRLVFLTAKLYYDVQEKRGDAAHLALVRVDELYPWPGKEIEAIADRYPNVTEVVWAQEEPRNMGAWFFAAPRLKATVGASVPMRYIGRPERASPAEGYESAHKEEQARIVAEILEAPPRKGKGPTREKATAKK